MAATLIYCYTYCLRFAVEGYNELKGHTAVTDYYASYYKKRFFQQCTEAKASVYYKTSCSFDGQWTSRFMRDMSKWVMLPIFLLALSNNYTSSKVRGLARLLYLVVLASHLALISCLEDIAAMLLVALLITLLTVLIVSNSPAIFAGLDTLLGRLDRFLDRWFFQRVNYASFRFKRMFKQVFFPWLGGLFWRGVFAVKTPVKNGWRYGTAPIDWNIDLSEHPPYAGLGPPRVGGPKPTVTGTEPADNTSGIQSGLETTPTAVIDTGPVERTFRVPGYASESSSSEDDQDSPRKNLRKKKGGKSVPQQMKDAKVVLKSSNDFGYGKPRPQNPMDVMDAGIRRQQASREKKYVEQQKHYENKIAKADTGLKFTADFVRNQREIDEYNEAAALSQQSQPFSGNGGGTALVPIEIPQQKASSSQIPSIESQKRQHDQNQAQRNHRPFLRIRLLSSPPLQVLRVPFRAPLS